MKIFKNVRGSMKYVPSIEVNVDRYRAVDTVYVRSNIERVEEMEFSGWEYDEVQYSLKEYISRLLDTEVGQLIIAENAIETLELVTVLNEQQKLEQAQSNAEIIELITLMGGM